MWAIKKQGHHFQHTEIAMKQGFLKKIISIPRRMLGRLVRHDEIVLLKMDSNALRKYTDGQVETHTDPDTIYEIYQKLGHSGDGISREKIIQRLDHGLDFYSYSLNDELVALTWFLTNVPRFIDEIAMTIIPEEPNYHWGRDFFIKKASRGRYLFPKFVSQVVDFYPSNEHFYLYSDVYASNRVSMAVHKRLGGKEFDRIPFSRSACWLYRKYDPAHVNYQAYKPGQRLLLMGPKFKQYIKSHMA